MKSFAEQLVDFVSNLEGRHACYSSVPYAHRVKVTEPSGDRFGIVDFWRGQGDEARYASIAFDSSNQIRWTTDGRRDRPTSGVSVISDLIGSLSTVLSSIAIHFRIVELSGDLIRVEVFAQPGCLGREDHDDKEPEKVALITSDQETNLITEFQSLM